MNILFYQHQYPAFGGIETVTTLLAGRFAEDGHLVKIVSFREKPGTDLLSRLPPGASWEKLPNAVIDAPENGLALRTIVCSFRPDVIVFQDSYAPIEYWLGNETIGDVPVIVVEHSMPRVPGRFAINRGGVVPFFKSLVVCALFPYCQHKRLCFERARRRRLYRLATRYVFLSPSYVDVSNRIAGVKAGEKAIAIPNPIRPQKLNPDVAAKRKEVLFCGSLITTKGVSRLIDIWGRIEPDFPEWTFRIVGDGPLRAELEGRVHRLGLKHVVFEGFRTDTERFYHAASILVMASSFEGWPMVLGEAMQQGCVPVVYDSFTSCRGIIDHGINGMIVPRFDRRRFVEVLSGLLNDAKRLAEMQRAAIKKAEGFSLSEIACCWYRLFDDARMARSVQ